MKSENQIIVRCKQPIKIEKPLQCLPVNVFLQCWWKKYSPDCFSSMSSKVITIVIQFMFLGINIFWALLRAHLKWVWVGPKTYLCPRTETLLLHYPTQPEYIKHKFNTSCKIVSYEPLFYEILPNWHYCSICFKIGIPTSLCKGIPRERS